MRKDVLIACRFPSSIDTRGGFLDVKQHLSPANSSGLEDILKSGGQVLSKDILGWRTSSVPVAHILWVGDILGACRLTS